SSNFSLITLSTFATVLGASFGYTSTSIRLPFSMTIDPFFAIVKTPLILYVMKTFNVLPILSSLADFTNRNVIYTVNHFGQHLYTSLFGLRVDLFHFLQIRQLV